MPLPDHQAGEDADRTDEAEVQAAVTIGGEFGTQEQRLAVCYAQIPKADEADPVENKDLTADGGVDDLETADAFDPSQPRDKNGEWGGHGENGNKPLTEAQKMGFSEKEHQAYLEEKRRIAASVRTKPKQKPPEATTQVSPALTSALNEIATSRNNHPDVREAQKAISRFRAQLESGKGLDAGDREKIRHALEVIRPKKKDHADDSDCGIEVIRADLSPLPKTSRTDEGFLRAPASRVARTGVQTYTRKDGKTQRELRLPEHVFDASSLATLDGKPVTQGHPKVRVDATNARQLSRGTVTNPRQADDFLAADLTIHDGETIAAVERGAGEISLGYRTTLVPIVDGVYRQSGSKFDGVEADYLQTNIRHNHAAVLARGRANEGTLDRPVRVRTDGEEQDVLRLDASGNQICEGAEATPPKSPHAGQEKTMIIKIDGVEHDVPDEVGAHLAKLEAERAAAQTKADAQAKRAADHEARADTAIERLTALEKVSHDATEAARGAERFALMKQAESTIKRPLAELVRMDDAELRRQILAAKNPKLKLDGKSDEYVASMLDHMSASEVQTRNSASDLRAPVTSLRSVRKDGEESPLMKAFADRDSRRNGRAEKKG